MRRVEGWLSVSALVLSTLGGCEQPSAAPKSSTAARAQAQLTRVQGDYRVRAPETQGVTELALKNGFTVRATLAGAPHGERWLELRIADERPQASEIAQDFVPVGPTVQLSLSQGSVDASFPAESFHLRRGYRLVLAVEGRACAKSAPCFELYDARLSEGACTATHVPARGSRLQFGQLPAVSAPGARSAAP